MLEWNDPEIKRLIAIGRTGAPFDDVAAEFGTTRDNARKRWQLHSTEKDRRTREMARTGLAPAPRPPYRAVARGGAEHQYNMNEPAVPRPRREFPETLRFSDDRRAAADSGSARRALPPSTIWALGGTILA